MMSADEARSPPMPVTARLSQLFYDRLGEQIANELVDWFNAVDSTYRADLRELNELNFSRFDAKLEQRTAQLDAKIDRLITGLEAKLERHVADLEAKLERHVAELEAKIERHVAELTARIDERASAISATFERRLGEQTRWLVAGWVTLLAAVIGLWVRG
jgi:DNA anti-recombination protein RmuC